MTLHDPPRRAVPLGDERLARQVTGGNSRAFSALYERYHRSVYRYCRSILRDDADTHDAVQSTFTHALEALLRGRRDAPVRPWLFRIAHNEAISVIRRRRAGDALPAVLEPDLVPAEDRFVHREALESLLTDLNELPERQRGAILMRELSGLSHDEIALALGTSVSGARQAIFEARAALAEFEQGRAMSCEEVRGALSEGDRRVLRGRRVGAHVRDCAACTSFMAEVLGRRARLRAVALPGAAVLVARVLHSGARFAAGLADHARELSGGLAGNLGDAAAAVKAVLGVVVLSVAAGGTAELMPGRHTAAPPSPPRPGAVLRAGSASSIARVGVLAGRVYVSGAARAANRNGSSDQRQRDAARPARTGGSLRASGNSLPASVGVEIRVAQTVVGGSTLPRQTAVGTSPRSDHTARTGGSGAGGGASAEPAGTSSKRAGAGQTQPSGQGNGSGGGGDAQGGGGGGSQGGGGGGSQGGGGGSQSGGGGQGGGNSQGDGNSQGGGNSQGERDA